MKTARQNIKANLQNAHMASECDKVGEIAIQYGFEVINPPKITPAHLGLARQFKDFDYYVDADEKTALIDWHMESGKETGSGPVLLHFKKPLPGSGRKKSSEDMYGFEIIGGGKATSEALILKVCLAVLSDAGYDDVCVELNSIGDRESIIRFERELASYYRKHAHELSAKLRSDFKKNHYCLLREYSKEVDGIKATIPQTIAWLSDLGRIHFKEVLEYVEAFEVPYKISGALLSNRLYASHTVFEIRDNSSENGKLLAYGYRYNYLAKKIGGKRDIPCVGATLVLKKNPAMAKKVLIKNIKKPKFYLVQLGNTAKLKALNIIELLRKHKISVYHSLTKDKITGQLSGAEYMHATHVLIIGQKEAIENTVVVRSIENRKQETVPLKDLPDFLKKIK